MSEQQLTLTLAVQLVEQPAHAAVFLPNILPLVTRVSNEVSNPECREVASQAVKTLQHLEKELAAVQQANKDITPEVCTSLSCDTHLLSRRCSTSRRSWLLCSRPTRTPLLRCALLCPAINTCCQDAAAPREGAGRRAAGQQGHHPRGERFALLLRGCQRLSSVYSDASPGLHKGR